MRSYTPILLLLVFSGSALGDRYVVTTNNDAIAPADGCSLREAIESVNANGSVSDCVAQPHPAMDRIEFQIPGDGRHTIVLGSSLPPLTRPVDIDGLSQPGSQCQHDLRIQITDDRAPPDYIEHVFSLNPGSAGSTIHGLSIIGVLGHSVPGGQPTVLRFYGDSVQINGAPDIRLECLNLGISGDGITADPVGHGIVVDGPVSGLIVGTDGDGIADEEEKNLLLAMGVAVNLDKASVGSVRVSGNWVGIDYRGRAPQCGPACSADHVANIGEEGFRFWGDVVGLMGYDGVGSRVNEGNAIRVSFSSLSAFGAFLSLQVSGNMFGASPDGKDMYPPRFGARVALGTTNGHVEFGLPQSGGDSEFTGNVVISRGLFASLEVYASGSGSTIQNSLFVGRSGHPQHPTRAIRHYGEITDHQTHIRGNFISGFDIAVDARPASQILATGNCIQGNREGVRGAPLQDFANNWWGSASGPSGDGPGDGDSVSGVNFLPFLAFPPDSCSLVDVVDFGPRRIPVFSNPGLVSMVILVFLLGLYRLYRALAHERRSNESN